MCIWLGLFGQTLGSFQPMANFAHCVMTSLINLRVASTAINARRLPLAILVYSLMTTTVVNNSVFRTFFEKPILTGLNFIDWYRNLRIVLLVEDKLPFLEQPIPAMPALKEIAGLMLMTMDPDIQKNLEQLGAYDMLKELKMLVGRIQKNQKKKPYKATKGIQGKGKAKMGYAPMHAPSFAPKPKNSLTPKKDNHAKDAKKLSQGSSTSGIFTIELYSFPSTSWVYDTGCGDGHRVGVEAIGEFHLCLPSGLVLILHNCHYALSITRGIISVSRLYDNGFVNHFDGNVLLVSKNNLVYFSAIPRDGIYKVDLSSSNTNDSSIYVVSNKRAKLNLDSTLLWHCRLGHISKKRIKKLQHDRLFDSTDIKSFLKCVSCMLGKMARKPHSNQVDRAKYLLGLIHTDVCDPFKIMSRQGASYFVTFTDDFSRYGYVYLLKHNHEVFETFKIFQKEVENQLGKTIKSLRSDRRGEYMSQEFLDHLKYHGIIAHRTPPYTPHHNGVSERRNRTLLDMVRSMISQTTLPNSFCDYTIESDARILNMVPTKKVDKTPYKVWHGQAPKLSYLKVWGCEALLKRDTLTKPDKLEPKSFSLITQEASGSLEDLEIIQEDTHPSIDTSLNHEENDQEIDEP
ncbi:retrotransposon protein, putative, ty1-copia subclass [Tanacetum coccineum]